VVIGDNVQLGPNVVLGSNTAPPPTGSLTTITQPADYNPARFDPVAYLPHAQALARQLVPDAQFVELEFDPVFSDGHVDLAKGRDHDYEFRSPSRSARPAGVPGNAKVERACMVHVEMSPASATASVRSSETCDARTQGPPRCHMPAIWKQALAAGTPSDYVARLGFLRDGTWFFDSDPDSTGKGGSVSTFADRCP
jgi:hypothetical protein